jgi:hypothetical protein
MNYWKKEKFNSKNKISPFLLLGDDEGQEIC